MEKGSELETFVLVLYKVISARLTLFSFSFFLFKKKNSNRVTPHGYGGAKGRSSLKSRGFSLKFGEGVPKVWRGAARKLSQSLAGRLK